MKLTVENRKILHWQFELISRDKYRLLVPEDCYTNFPLKKTSPTIGRFEHLETSKKRKMFCSWKFWRGWLLKFRHLPMFPRQSPSNCFRFKEWASWENTIINFAEFQVQNVISGTTMSQYWCQHQHNISTLAQYFDVGTICSRSVFWNLNICDKFSIIIYCCWWNF